MFLLLEALTRLRYMSTTYFYPCKLFIHILSSKSLFLNQRKEPYPNQLAILFRT